MAHALPRFGLLGEGILLCTHIRKGASNLGIKLAGLHYLGNKR